MAPMASPAQILFRGKAGDDACGERGRNKRGGQHTIAEPSIGFVNVASFNAERVCLFKRIGQNSVGPGSIPSNARRRGSGTCARQGAAAACRCGEARGPDFAKTEFATDSPLEGDGFELPVPRGSIASIPAVPGVPGGRRADPTADLGLIMGRVEGSLYRRGPRRKFSKEGRCPKRRRSEPRRPPTLTRQGFAA
jgi:hypothetical protein